MTIWIIIGTIIIVALAVLFIVCVSRYTKLSNELDALETRLQSATDQNKRLQEKVTTLEADNKKQLGWLDTLDEDLKWHKGELAKRPVVNRKVYRILTVGMKATGKSSLTLKWANPLVDLGTIEGTKMERYERTVSQVKGKESLTEHVFEVHDWGGEHIVDAQEELVMGEIYGILMVVDLGGRDARQVEQHRIVEQLNEFNPQALKFFLTPKIVASCKTIVLFINKSDLIPGPPAQAEAQAKNHYAPLIESLHQYTTHIDVKVMVGSASFGHSTHVLFSHFVEQILPSSAYDQQLLQRIKGTEPRKRTQTVTPGINGGVHALPLANLAQGSTTSNGYMTSTRMPAPLGPPPPPPNAQSTRMTTSKMGLPLNADEYGGMDTTIPLAHRKHTPPPVRKS